MDKRGPALLVLSSAVWAAESRTTGLLWEEISVQNTVIVADCKTQHWQIYST